MLVRDKKYLCVFTLFIFPLNTNFKPLSGRSAEVDVLRKNINKTKTRVRAPHPEWVPFELPFVDWAWGMPGRLGIIRVPILLWQLNTEYYFENWCSNLVHGQEVKFLLELIRYLELPPLGIQGLDLRLFKSLGWSSLKNLTWHFVHSERSPWQR